MSELTGQDMSPEAAWRRIAGAGTVLGVLTLLLGIVIMVWPHQTVLVVAVLFGIYLLVSGIAQLVQAVVGDLSGGHRALLAFSGIFSVVLGLLAFRSLTHSVAILALFVGFGWLIRGIVVMVSAISEKGMPGRGWFIFSGALSAIAGVIILAEPAPSLTIIAWTSGILLVVLGIVEVIASFQLRKYAAA